MGIPTVSVLLPVRDAADTVERAVKSVLSERAVDLELLAIDDGSVDESRLILERLAAADARMRVLGGNGRGIVHALEVGLGEARAPLIARMDADDESLPGRFVQSLAFLEAHPALAGVGTQVEIFREDRPVSPNLLHHARWLNGLVTPELLFRDRLVESPLCNPSTLLRRSAIDAVGGWRDGPFPEDWDFFVRLLEAGHRLCCVPALLFRWRDHDRRVTWNDPRYARERHWDLRADVLARRFEGTPLTIWGAGEVGLQLARRLRERGRTLVQWIEVDARKIGQTIEGLPVIDFQRLGPPSPSAHLIASVGAKGAREEIRAFLLARQWVEGEHFTCAA